MRIMGIFHILNYVFNIYTETYYQCVTITTCTHENLNKKKFACGEE